MMKGSRKKTEEKNDQEEQIYSNQEDQHYSKRNYGEQGDLEDYMVKIKYQQNEQ